MMLFWTAALALTVLLYVLLDGFDLGVGVLTAFTRDEKTRDRMMSAIAPVWDGNETWLVITGTILFGAFPRLYALVLSSFYLPMIAMLGALILRGVAFEFREKARRSRRLWEIGFSGGSLVASFIQGMTLGALVQGLPVENGHYVGGPFGWFTSFSCLCGVGLCVGYALLGAGWLVAKSVGRLRDHAYAVLPALTVAAMMFLGLATVVALILHIRLMNRWIERPYLVVFPLIGAFAALQLVRGIRSRRDIAPFVMTGLIFLSAFCVLALSFWPYVVPFSLTVDEAVAPTASLSFMFWGAGLIVLPLTLAYSAVVYGLFSGKLEQSETGY
jgi:cytochrome bd ubiquinol oxidase subunit II